MLEPNAIVIYVNNLENSSRFYQDILGILPAEASPTFHMFKLSNGMGLGLKNKDSVQPKCKDNASSSGELVFTAMNNDEVDALFLDWNQKGIQMAQLPTNLPFGYTFVAEDPDGHRLRVISLAK